MNKIDIRLSILSLLYLCMTNMSAQITIGADLRPNKGVLLDLKQWESINGGENSNKGLGLPRVKLTVRNDITVDISGLTAAESDDHIGLVVYNIYEDVCASDPLPIGPYVWDGREWVLLLSPNTNVKTFIDDRDPNNPVSYRYRDFGEAGEWMLDNLVAKRFAGESADIDVFNGSTTDQVTPFYSYPNASTTAWGTAPANWDSTLGLLYNWAAATNKKTIITEEGEGGGSPNTETVEQIGVQGICPNGWHLPSDKEWNLLEKQISENPSVYSTETEPIIWLPTFNYSSSGAERGNNPAMKSPCPVPETVIVTNGKSNNAATGGFNIKLVGVINAGRVVNYGRGTILRSSSSDKSASGWIRSFSNISTGVIRSTASRVALYSVRCKRN